MLLLGCPIGVVRIQRCAVGQPEVSRPPLQLVPLACPLVYERHVCRGRLGPRHAFDAGAPGARKADAPEVEAHPPGPTFLLLEADGVELRGTAADVLEVGLQPARWQLSECWGFRDRTRGFRRTCRWRRGRGGLGVAGGLVR